MNKENNLNDLSAKFENVSISSSSVRLTRSQSRLKPQNKIIDKVSSIKLEEKIDLKISKIPKVKKNIETINNVVLSYNREFIVGRESEISQISQFLERNFEEGTNGNLYISGSPGTGKTVVVTELVESAASERRCASHFVNCMELVVARRVYPQLWRSLSGGEEVSDCDRAATKIEECLRKRSSRDLPLVFVLDELDQLTNSRDRVLYRIFQWMNIPKCKLIIIGIANTLDLTESKLPDLILETCRPQHINFPPYNETELSAIIMSRVKVELNASEKSGVTLCCKKVSSKSGDARTALDLYKRAAAISEDDQLSLLRAESTEVVNVASTFSSPLKRNLSTPHLLSIRRSQFITPSSPSIKHVSRAIKEVEKTSNPYKNIVNVETGESSLPLHHKLVLCAALVLSKNKKSKNTIGQLYEMYMKVCGLQHIEGLDMSELVNICDLLDSRALMRLGPHKEIRQKKFTLNVDEGGIESALSDNCLLSSIMDKLYINK